MPTTAEQDTKKILIVDDDEQHLELIIDLLSKEDYELNYALSGEDALDKIENSNPDLILLDINLPDLSGFEVASSIDEREEFKEIPVLFITGYTDRGYISKAFDAGAFDYITKPINEQELLTRVDHTLRFYSYKEELEEEILKQTEELIEKNQELKQTNETLEVLLDRVEKREIETWNKIQEQVLDLVEPYLKELMNLLEGEKLDLAEHIHENLNEIFNQKAEGLESIRSKLTSREYEICTLIQKGMTSKKIASKLDLSISTIKNHRNNIREKLKLTHTDTQLTEYIKQL